MSIVNLVINKKPEEGECVYCDNKNYSSDRAIYKNGRFIGGGEFPVRSYVMNHVTKWFSMSKYDEHHKDVASYSISFYIAESLTEGVGK